MHCSQLPLVLVNPVHQYYKTYLYVNLVLTILVTHIFSFEAVQFQSEGVLKPSSFEVCSF